jgi:hypothetical protein
VFTIWPQGRALAAQEFVLPYVALAAAAIGALSGWIAGLVRSSANRHESQVQAVARLWAGSSPILITAIYLFSVAGPWAGVERPGDYHSVAIAGFVPFSDAGGHLQARCCRS